MQAPSPNERGWALVSVLCVVSMLALMAAATEELTIASSRIERAAGDATEIDADFDAGLARAVVGISDKRPNERWRVDGITRKFAFDGASMTIAVQDESGRFDLNAVDGSTVRRLLESAGLSLDEASRLSDRILDWRSASGLEHLQGASDADYAAKGYAWRPRHGPFQSVDELKLVMGITPELFAHIRPALTVYTKRPAIDPQIAPREALRALFYDDPDKADSIVKTREDAAVQGAPIDTVDPALSQGGRIYTIAVDLVKRDRHRHREYVVMLTGEWTKPYVELAYR